MKLDATLEIRTSKEGKQYEVVVLKLSQSSEKLVFLSPAEKEVYELIINDFFVKSYKYHVMFYM